MKAVVTFFLFTRFFQECSAFHTSSKYIGDLQRWPSIQSRKCIVGVHDSNNGRNALVLNANLITFDLDDTLFPVGPVVNDANVALIQHMNDEYNCPTTQDDFLKSAKVIRTELAKNEQVITYTELRKRTIRMELEKYLDPATISHEGVVAAYDLWESQRHLAAERHLYKDTVLMLEQIRKAYPDVVIAAITNGKGNPLEMESIAQFFDFCVSGEDDDVFPLRKPHEGIYKVAFEKFCQLCKINKGDESITMENQCWIHVGDDLANDVGASAKCGAYAVWVDLDEEYNQNASKRDTSAAQPAWSTATKEEIEKRILMNEKAEKFVSERVTSLEKLPRAVEKITESIFDQSR